MFKYDVTILSVGCLMRKIKQNPKSNLTSTVYDKTNTLRKDMSMSYVVNFKFFYVYDQFISNSTNHNGTDSTITRLLVASWDLVFKNGFHPLDVNHFLKQC